VLAVLLGGGLVAAAIALRAPAGGLPATDSTPEEIPV
jgi:hypothetical protein